MVGVYCLSLRIECAGLAALSEKLEYLENLVSILEMLYIKLKGIIYSKI